MKNFAKSIRKDLLKIALASFAMSTIPLNAEIRITGSWCGDGPDTGATIEFFRDQSFSFELASGEQYGGMYLINNGKVNMVFYNNGAEANLIIDKRNQSLEFYESANNNSSFTRCGNENQLIKFFE